MLEILLGLFVLLVMVSIMLLPIISFALLIIYIVAPNLLPFKNRRQTRGRTADYRTQGRTYTRPASQSRPRKTAAAAKEQPEEPKKPAEPKKPTADIIITELSRHTEGIIDEELKEKCTAMTEKLKKIRAMEAETKELKTQMENMYESYLPSFVNVLSRYERLQYSGDEKTLAEYRSKVLRTAEVIDGALENIYSAAAMANVNALGRDMQELEIALKADGVAGQLQFPRQDQ